MTQAIKNSKTFEIVFSVALLAPILFFFFGSILGSSLGFLFSLIVSLVFPVLLIDGKFDKKNLLSFFPTQERETFGFFLFSFSCCLYFCLSWPDFIAIGERLRDYALLASVKDFPLVAKEPWMVGSNLNYYLYWYRFAAYWSTIFGLETWQSYHLLSAFTFSFFITCLFRLLRAYFSLPLIASACFSILIAFGSNISGVYYAYTADSNWWGPSRVIKGTINEFPAWSFLLGDLHPHFLNLSLTLFICCLTFSISKLSLSVLSRVFLSLLLFLVSAPLYYNTNAWEVPMAGITFGLIVVFLFIPNFSSIIKNFKLSISEFSKDFKNQKFLSIATILVICMISLILSCRNIQPADYPWRWVKSPVEKSTLFELFLHWGFPISLIILALFNKISTQNNLSKILFFLFALSFAVCSYSTSLIILAVCLSAVGLTQIRQNSELTNKLSLAILYSLGVSCLLLIALGEIIYLDDPYGGENERMNTVFKIYSACWAPLHLFAFLFSYFEFNSQKVKSLILLSAIACLPAFFANSIKYRNNQSPSIEGLASVDQEFPGATEAIRYLRSLPRTTVLEAQGNPYSYTSFLSTLGGDDSYLGWANHVGLLTGKHEEVGRREKITAEIYNQTDCTQKKVLAKAEGINLIAIGYLERRKYTESGLNSFGCMTVKYNAGQHKFVSPD